MSGNQLFIVTIHSSRIARLRDGKHRRLAIEQLERRWLLSAAADATGWWPEVASAPDSATPWPAAPAAESAAAWPVAAPAIASAASLPAAPAPAGATAWPAVAPVAANAPTLLAAASAADCSNEGGWADVGTTTTDNNSNGSSGQTNSASSAWSSSGIDQLPAKKPGLLVLSPDEFRSKAAGEGGLADVTRLSIQPPMALLAASPSGEAVGTSEDGAVSSGIKLDGLRGTSQAFDVAIAPGRTPTDGTTLVDPSAELRFRPAALWPMPMLPHMRPEGGGLPSASALPGAAQLPGDGKTTFTPANPPASVPLGSSAESASELRIAETPPSTTVTLSEGDSKHPNGKFHDRVLARVADFVHDLSVAARLNDRRVEAAVVAIALAAMPYRRFRKRDDPAI